MTITDAFELYRDDYIVSHNQSAKTEENHFICMRVLVQYFGDVDIASIDRLKVRAWRAEITKTRSPQTVRNYVIKLRVVLGYLIDEGYTVLHPKYIAVPKVKKKSVTFVTPAELDLMIDACDSMPVRINRARNKAILALLGSSGLRVDELCRMTINQALLDDFSIDGKSSEPRLCFIDPRARRLIDSYLNLRKVGYSVTSRGRVRSVRKEENERALFINNQNGSPLTPADVQLLVRNAARRAGLTKKVTPHTVRHGFATDLLMQGCDLYSLSKMMGHQSLETTALYLHVADPHLKEQYQKYHSV